MSRLENRLREVLKHEDPPSGFTERVLARANESNQTAWIGIFVRHRLAVAVAGALCLMLVVGGMEYRQRQVEIAQSEAAKQQLMLALQIAGEQLQFVQSKIIQP